jgi:hypothetical protein
VTKDTVQRIIRTFYETIKNGPAIIPHRPIIPKDVSDFIFSLTLSLGICYDIIILNAYTLWQMKPMELEEPD